MNESREELLSAYLDDQLSAEERAQVESWLAADSEYRQLYDELRSVRGRLQSLERHKVGHDLGPAVIRRAERTVLAGEAAPTPSDRREPGAVRQWWSGRSWRMIAWPALAAAAALAIVLYDAGQQPERKVAREALRRTTQGPGAASSAAPDAAMKAPQVADNEGRASGDDEYTISNVIPARPQPAPYQLRANAALPKNEPSAAASAEQAPADKPPTGMIFQRDSVDNGVVCDVTAEYIESGTFENLLDAKKLVWRRQDVATRQSKPSQSAAKKQQPAPAQYTVHLTPDELTDVVAALVAESEGVLKIDRAGAAKVATKELADLPQSRQSESKQAGARQAVTFWLRPVDPDDDAKSK